MPKGPPVVMMGYGIWKDQFSGDPHVVGRTLRLDGVARTIVGVLPAEAEFPGEVRLWVPFAGDPNQAEQSYSADGIGRLKPGVTAAQAQRDLSRAHQPVWDARDKERVVSPFVRPLRDQFVRDFRNAASTLLAAVAILLVVACANVASVMLARPVTLYRLASPDYFKTMDVRLEDGRFVDEHDGRDRRNVVIVNETFARIWHDGRSPVGRRIKGTGSESPWMTVVGLVRDVRHYGLERPMRPGIYQPLPVEAPATLSVALHASVAPESLTRAARAALRELDPDLPLFRVQTMETAMRRSLRTRTTISWLLGIFAAMALVLALGGSYGVVSYLATQRTREIGIRTALGARNRDIILAVVGRGIASVSAGILVGIGSSMAASRLMAEMLFGVPADDRAVLSSVAIALLATAAAASWLPARRAARVQPLQALRTE